MLKMHLNANNPPSFFKKIKNKKFYSNQIYFYSLIKINFNFKIMELADKTSFKDLEYIYIYGVGAR